MAAQIVAQIRYNKQIAKEIFRLGMESAYITGNSRPGQFVNIKCNDGLDALLRRPLSICSACPEKGIFDVVYMVRGQGTEHLSKMKAGDMIDIMGPLGNSFHISGQYSRIAVVGGGIGIFPLLFLLKNIPDKVIKHTYLGFRNSECAVLLDEFNKSADNVMISCDDGSMGEKGFVTDMLQREMEEYSYGIIYACGPEKMLEKVVSTAYKRNIPCQVSMEQRMGCGIGACLVCACKTRSSDEDGWDYSHVCSDGPVFWGNDVIFD